MSSHDTFEGIAARAMGVLTLVVVAACGSSPPPSAPSVAASASPPPAPVASSAAPAPPEPLAAPGPVVIARGLGAASDLAASETFLYVAKNKSVITRIPLAGGPAEDIATFAEQAFVEAMAPSAEGLYVLTTAIGAEAKKQGYAGQGSLFLIPAKGGDAQALAQGFTRPASILVDDTSVHWTAVKDAGKKPAWYLFSAPRKTGTPLTATPLGDKGADAKIPAEQRSARLLGLYKNDAVVAWDKGAIFVHPFGPVARGAGGPTLRGLSAYTFASRYTALRGDHLAVAGSATRDGKTTSVVGLASLAAPEQDFVPFATLEGTSRLGGVAFAGDDVLYTLTGTTEHHDKDGSVVRVSAGDAHAIKATVLASDQFQPTEIVVTSRGIVWLDKGGTDTDEPDGTLLLLPK